MSPPSKKEIALFVRAEQAQVSQKKKDKRRKRKKDRKKRQPNPLGVEPGLLTAYGQYKAALRDPFSSQADGVRMPDTYRYPTVTMKVGARATLRSDASGVIAFQIFPQPLMMLQMGSGICLGFTATSANSSLLYLTSPAALLSSGYSQYRVVSWGFRLLLADTVSAAKGIYTVAPFPLPKNNYLDWGILNGNAITGGVYIGDYVGVPRANASAEILPNRRVFNAQDLQYKGDFMAVGVPYCSACAEFRSLPLSTQTAFSNTKLFNNDYGSMVYMSATLPSTVGATGNLNTLDMAGNLGYVVYATGLPVSTDELSLEVVYHLELVPTPTVLLVGMPNATASPTGSTSLLEKVFTSVKDTLYLGREPLSKGLMQFGMRGIQYAMTRRSRIRYLE